MGKRKRKRTRRKNAGPTLFDLPLHAGGEAKAGEIDVETRGATGWQASASRPEEAPVAGQAAGQGPTILFDAIESGAEDKSRLDRIELAMGTSELVEPEDEPPVEPPGVPTPRDEPPRDETPRDEPSRGAVPAGDQAFLGDRLLGGLADLAAQLIALGLAIAATHAMDIVVTVADWMPFGVLALVFSFLYWMVPLAFWGQTPGMAWVGHTARSSSGEPLSFGQTFLRWLGSMLTLALAGLPLLIALTGRSLTDRISDSRTTAAAP